MQGNLIESRSNLSSFSKAAMVNFQINKAMNESDLSESCRSLLSGVESSIRKLLSSYVSEKDVDVISQTVKDCRAEIISSLLKHKEVKFTKLECIAIMITAGIYAYYSYKKHENDVNFVERTLSQLDNNQSFSKDDIKLLADSAVEFSVGFLKMEEEEARKEVRYHFESIFGGTTHNPDLKSFEKIKNFVPQHYFNENALNLVELWYIRNIDDDSAADVRRNYLYHKIDKILNNGGEMTDKQIAERKGIFGKKTPLKEVEVRQNKINSIVNALKEVYESDDVYKKQNKDFSSLERNVDDCLQKLEKRFSKHEQGSLVNLIFRKFEEIRKTPTDPSENLFTGVNGEGSLVVNKFKVENECEVDQNDDCLDNYIEDIRKLYA